MFTSTTSRPHSPAASWSRFDHAVVSLWRAHPADGAPDLDALAGIDVDARVAWAKLKAMSDGAAIASKQLW